MGDTALTSAASYGNTYAVEDLLLAGADMDYKNKFKNNMTAYQLTMQGGHLETAEVLRKWAKFKREQTKEELDELGYLLGDLNEIVCDYTFEPIK